TLHRDGVLRTHIYVTLGSADGITGDGHGLQYGVGIALQDGTVHERPRVALVRVAADIFLVRLVGRRELPFQARGESGAAASPKAAVQQDLDHVLRRLLREHDAQRLIAAGSDVFLDIFRVDHT